jgi:coenzyme F420-0:L-glutamate ligase/coenzyme F420-1:gamma-L-glutamate ligase
VKPTSYFPLTAIGEITAGTNLAAALAQALRRDRIAPGTDDVIVVAQKIVSKAEGCFRNLADVVVSARARELAAITGKDPRVVEVVLSESIAVLRAKPNVLIVRHRLGFVLAQAGVDRSNVPGDDRVLLLPPDPDASAAELRQRIAGEFGLAIGPGVVISDSFGRAWRMGTTNVAIGAAGVPALWDRRGEKDRHGRPLQVTQVAWADAVAGAAGLVMGEGAEGIPAVLVRGLCREGSERPAESLLRPLDEDLFP